MPSIKYVDKQILQLFAYMSSCKQIFARTWHQFRSFDNFNKNIDRSQNIIYPLKATFNIFIMQWKKWSNKDNLTPIYHLNQIFKKYTENSVFWKMECLLNLLMTNVLKDTITNLF